MDKLRDALAGMFAAGSPFRQFKKYRYIANVDGSRVGVVLATCDVARYGANFALGVAGVQDLIAAKRSSKVAHGFMVAASVDKFNALSYVDHKEIEEFNAVLLQKLRPRTSEYGGEYWLLTPAMITNCAVVEDDEAF